MAVKGHGAPPCSGAMCEADDLRREASDPRTSGERLREILAEATAQPLASRAHDRWHQASPERLRLRAAVLRNPTLPLEVVRAALRQERTPQMALDAWHNPVVPLLLLSEPTPEYHEAARRLLATLTPHRLPGSSLGSLMAQH